MIPSKMNFLPGPSNHRAFKNISSLSFHEFGDDPKEFIVFENLITLYTDVLSTPVSPPL
jgi:hypothetical protein